jgi:hypothetical protein
LVPPNDSSPADVVIRPYGPDDRQAIRDICCRTAFRNLGARALLDDAELFADYWTGYYTDFEPESALVAERSGRVIGYLTGCLDTKRQIRVMATRVVPPVLVKLATRAARGRYRDQPRAHALLRWLLLRAWREAPHVDLDRFPAHYHINLVRDGYRRGLYTRLALTFVDRLEAHGVARMHGQVTDAATGGVWRRLFDDFRARYPQVESQQWEAATTLGRTVLGLEQELMNRAWGGSLDAFRLFLSDLAEQHGL